MAQDFSSGMGFHQQGIQISRVLPCLHLGLGTMCQKDVPKWCAIICQKGLTQEQAQKRITVIFFPSFFPSFLPQTAMYLQLIYMNQGNIRFSAQICLWKKSNYYRTILLYSHMILILRYCKFLFSP